MIVSNTYGRGKTILFAFDLLNSIDQNTVLSLIVNSINYVVPTERNTRALTEEPIRIDIQNSTEPVDIQVTETISANTSADMINPTGIEEGSTIQWELSLGTNEKKELGYWLLLPDMAGNYETSTELRYGNQGNYRLYGNYSLTFSVDLNSSDLLKQIISDLQSLSVSKSDAGHVNNALYYLGLIKDYTGITKTDVQNNINDILNALTEINKVSVDVSSIRLKLDELLRIWQAKWSLAADAVSQVSRYKLAYETDSRKLDKKVSVCHSGLYPESSLSSFPRTSVGNPLPCNNPIVLASTGSSSGITSTTTIDTIYFYHTDHLGTPMLMTDKDQNIVWQKETLPFGEDYSSSGSITNNLGFPGQYYDSETGRYYNWHRYYNSEIGRYDQFDPILHPGNGQSKCGKNKNLNIPSFESLMRKPQQLNPYGYAVSNPLNYIDPTGLACGTGWTDTIVPDSYGSFNFTSACTEHDACYDTCGSNKLVCDSMFLNDLLAECSKLTWYPVTQVSCVTAATVYYGFVASPLGWYAYRNAQKKACCK